MKIEIFEDVEQLNNEELLELYRDFVKVDHYDPCETPSLVVKVKSLGIRTFTLERMILQRMK